MIPIASNLSQSATASSPGRRSPWARPQPAVLPTPSDVPIGRIIVRTFIVLLAIAGGIFLSLILGVLLGFIPIGGFC